jgi:hypothetical protein
MGQAATYAVASGWSSTAAGVAIAAITVSLAALVLLHILNPEYAMSWRMVSEYANGRYPWLLAIVFLSWAAGSFGALAAQRYHAWHSRPHPPRPRRYRAGHGWRV